MPSKHTAHKLFGAFLAFVVALAVAATPVANAAESVVNYNWTAPLFPGWTKITQDCMTVNDSDGDGHGELTMTCQSAALQSIQTWDPTKDLTIEGSVSGEPAPGSSTNRYWAGLVLFQADDGPDARYAQLASVRGVNPINYTSPKIASLTLPSEPGGKVLSDGSSGQSYVFKIVYDYSSRTIKYYVNGNSEQTRKNFRFTEPVRIWTLCVSVSAGQPNDGSNARCVFGPLKVTGQKL